MRPDDIMVTDVTLDSREVRPGALFLACRGHEQGQGTRTALNSRRRPPSAARARSSTKPRPPARPGPWMPRPGCCSGCASAPARTRISLWSRFRTCGPTSACIADRFFGQPSQALQVVGVTGTNGKTTCAWLIAQALSLCGRPAAYIGTLGYGAAGALRPVTHTTSDVVSVHRQLARAARGAAPQAVAMEVSSHALDQGRVDEVRFATAAFTNLTQDHLDYHGTLAGLWRRQGAAVRATHAGRARHQCRRRRSVANSRVDRARRVDSW